MKKINNCLFYLELILIKDSVTLGKIPPFRVLITLGMQFGNGFFSFSSITGFVLLLFLFSSIKGT